MSICTTILLSSSVSIAGVITVTTFWIGYVTSWLVGTDFGRIARWQSAKIADTVVVAILTRNMRVAVVTVAAVEIANFPSAGVLTAPAVDVCVRDGIVVDVALHVWNTFSVDLNNTIKIIAVEDANTLCITIIHHVTNVVFCGTITVTSTSDPCVLVAGVSEENVTGFANAIPHKVVCALHGAVTLR